MTSDFEDEIHDSELIGSFKHLVDQLGGFNLLTGPITAVDVHYIELRHSPIAGRISATVSSCVWLATDDDEGTEVLETKRTKIKWEPENGCLYSVIPWSAIDKRSARIEGAIRDLAESGLSDADPELNRLLVEEAQIKLGQYAKSRPSRARDLAEELCLVVLN